MADISKIKTLDGTTYDIKDAVARDGKVSSGIMEILNPFAPEQSKKLYIDRLENALYFADKRWIVTGTVTSSTGATTALSTYQIANLFDMGEENMSIPPAGGTLVLTIDFTGNDGTDVFPNYPYGILCMDFYYTAAPQSVSARVYGKHTGSTSFWQTLTVTADPQNTAGQIRYRANQAGMYNMQKLEITVVAKSDSAAALSEVSYYLTRANKDKDMPYVSKLKPEKLYYNLTAPSFIGDLTGKVNGHTVNKDVPANAVFTDTTYSSKAAASGGTDVSLVTTGEKYTWNNKGPGTITGITMNGASKGTSGVVDLGTVITAHQDISGKVNKSGDTITGDLLINGNLSVHNIISLGDGISIFNPVEDETGDSDASVWYTSNNNLGITNGTLYVKSSTLDVSDPPSSGAVSTKALSFVDTNGTQLSSMYAFLRSNGSRGATLRNVGANSTNNELVLEVLSDGTRKVSVSDPAAWREGIGVNETAITVTMPSSAPSGVATLPSIYAYKAGHIVMVNIEGLKIGSTVPTSWTTLATNLPLPPRSLYFEAQPTAPAGGTRTRFRIDTSGVLAFAYGTANGSYNYTFTYIIPTV